MCDSQYATSSHFLIRSADRNDYWNTTPSKFSINLSKPLKGTKAQISFCQIPNTYNNVHSGNNAIEVNGTTYFLNPGCYSLQDLMNALMILLTPEGVFTITFNAVSGLITISLNVNFTLNLNINNSLSKVIGFNPNNTYIGSNFYNGSQIPKVYDSSIYLGCNFATHIQTTSNLKNVSFVIPHNCNRGELIQFYSSTQFALQPHVTNQTIGNIDFIVFDETGRVLENLADWSIMIQII